MTDHRESTKLLRTKISRRGALKGLGATAAGIVAGPGFVRYAQAQSSAPIKNGEYRVGGEWGLVPGTYQVRINAYRPPTDKSNMLAGGFLDKPPTTPGIPAREQFPRGDEARGA